MAALQFLDTKDLLLQTLMAGYQGLGFGIQPLNDPPADNAHPYITFARAFGQSALDRPLITVARTGGDARPEWLGNTGSPVGYTGLAGSAVASSAVPTIPLRQSFRIQVESLDTTGGISTVDWLVESASTILLNAYQTLILPLELGGGGLYFVRWTIGTDSARPFQEIAGKIVYSNQITFECTRFVWGTPPTPGTSIGAFLILPSVYASDGTTVLPNNQITLDIEFTP
jgi:hypothetical protein